MPEMLHPPETYFGDQSGNRRELHPLLPEGVRTEYAALYKEQARLEAQVEGLEKGFREMESVFEQLEAAWKTTEGPAKKALEDRMNALNAALIETEKEYRKTEEVMSDIWHQMDAVYRSAREIIDAINSRGGQA